VTTTAFLELEVAGERITFFAGKGALWKRTETLLVADLHWGKTGVFQAAGIPIPDDLLDADLERLQLLIATSGARRVIVLGDLIHAPHGLNPTIQEKIASWRRHHPIPMGVILGNHDRSFGHIPKSWDLENLGEESQMGPFSFRHDPSPSPTHHVWCGHVHPMMTIGVGHDRMRLPCFWLRRGITVLPSFSLFTRGANVQPKGEERAILVHDEGLSLWPS
jgi:hypothetical protein